MKITDITIKTFQVLLISFATQGSDNHSLGFTAGKKRRAVSSGKSTNLAADRPYFIK